MKELICFVVILQMHLLPGGTVIFGNNTASRLGGAMGVENVRSKNDVSASLNDFCFIQYNIGSKNELKPDDWEVSCMLKKFPSCELYIYIYIYIFCCFFIGTQLPCNQLTMHFILLYTG